MYLRSEHVTCETGESFVEHLQVQVQKLRTYRILQTFKRDHFELIEFSTYFALAHKC